MQQTRSVFHDGERAVQARAGVSDEWLMQAEGFMRAGMPQQHRDFFEHLEMLFMGLLDSAGRPWCVPAFGPRGFLVSPAPDTLQIHRDPVLSCELCLDRSPGASVGLLGIDLTNRRRNRLNGRVQHASTGEMTILVDQSFGNCPQYIQTRHQPPGQDEPAAVGRRCDSITAPEVRRMIESADTFLSPLVRLGHWMVEAPASMHRTGEGGRDFLASTKTAPSLSRTSPAIAFSTHWATLRVMAGSACSFRISKRVKRSC